MRSFFQGADVSTGVDRDVAHGGVGSVPGVESGARPQLSWTSRISSGISEGMCKRMAQSGREFLNIRVSCGQ